MKKIFLLLLFLTSTVFAHDVKLIVPFSPGGSSDKLARVLLPLISNTEYNFVIEYKLGAGGAVAAEYVAKVKDETVIMINTPGLVGNPIITQSPTYQTSRDFIFVKYLGAEPLLVVVNTKGTITNYKKFNDFTKRYPTMYGSAGIGTSSHISAAIIANNNPMIVNVPYKGSATVLADLIENRLTWAVDSDAVLAPYIENNNLIPVAIYGHKRLAKYPNVPTLKELKINDQEFYRWHVLVANANADAAVVSHIQQRLMDPKVKTAIENLGIDTTPVKNSNTFLKDETVKLQRIIKDFNIIQ
jgi:tripartite-type tricarboxylate transporter receptor subunit TctC